MFSAIACRKIAPDFKKSVRKAGFQSKYADQKDDNNDDVVTNERQRFF